MILAVEDDCDSGNVLFNKGIQYRYQGFNKAIIIEKDV